MRICRIITLTFAAAYVVALALLAIGTFGLFGQEQDPLSAVFVVLLGLPWTQFLNGYSETARLWGAIAAPAVNLLILIGLCRALRRESA